MSPKRKPAPDLSHIAEDLRPLAVPIGEVKLDPKNARTHDKRNLSAIAASLKRFGQRKPIVVNAAGGQVEAGHGTLLAARQLGWKHLAAVRVRDDPATARGFSIADNRTAELAGWDDAILEELLGQMAGDDARLYDALFLDELRQGKESAGGDQSDAGDQPVPEEFKVIVTCRDEEDQRGFFERMEKEGRSCRLLTL